MNVKKISIYVSPNGNDANDGSIERPLASFQAAKQKAQRLKSPKTQVSVIFRGGNYFITNNIVFGCNDGGYEGAPVIYKAYRKEKPVFIGGVRLDNSKMKKVTDEEFLSRLVDQKAKNKVYCIEIPELADYLIENDTTDGWTYLPLEAFENEKPMELARYPKRAKGSSSVFGPYGRVIRYRSNKSGIRAYFDKETAERMKKWSDFGKKDAIADGYFHAEWSQGIRKIDKIDAEKGCITFQSRGFAGYMPARFPNEVKNISKRVFIKNIPDELSQPGEYYIDREKCIFYFIPSKPIEKEEIYINTLSGAMISFEMRTHFVNFEGISFKYCRGSFIEGNDVRDIIFDGVEMAHGTKRAMVYRIGRNITVKNSHIYDMGEGGIYTEYYGEGVIKDRTRFLTVENCDIHDVSRVVHCYSGCVSASYHSANIVIRNNKFHSSPHLLLGMRCTNDVLIENNEFYDAVRESDDAGVVYWGRSSRTLGIVIRNNYFHDCGNTEAKWGICTIYTDDAGVGADIYNNVFANVTCPAENADCTVIKEHPESFSHIHNNIFVGANRIHTLGTWDYRNNSGLSHFFPNALGAKGSHGDDRFTELCECGFFSADWKKRYEGTIWSEMWNVVSADKVAIIQKYRQELEAQGVAPEIVNGKAILLADEISWNHKIPGGGIYEGSYWDYVKTELKDVYEKAVAEVEGKGEKALLDRLHLLTVENYWYHLLVNDNTVKTYDNVCVGILPKYIDEDGTLNLGFYKADSEFLISADDYDAKKTFIDAENGNYTLTEEMLSDIMAKMPGFIPFGMNSVGVKK